MSREVFIEYYHRELRYLRNAGMEFARQHPKIARRLDLHQLGESPDPHVERLIESFAFLTAKLGKEIDDRLPQVAAGLLEAIYPQALAPMPPVTIAHFRPDSMKIQATTGYTIPIHTPLFAYAEEGVTCQFLTNYPVTLWPIVVTEAAIVSVHNLDFVGAEPRTARFLSLKLQSLTAPLEALSLQHLTFFIHADRSLALLIYEMLFKLATPQIALSTDRITIYPLPQAQLKEVGFASHEALSPAPEQAHPAYQVIQDYFHCPEKFLFFTVEKLQFAKYGQTAYLLLGLDPQVAPDDIVVTANNFLLGCTPVINLFSKITDPIGINQRQTSYRLVPDARRERTTEIHSINKVVGIKTQTGEERVYHPYFSFNHQALQQNQQTFWVGSRAPISRPNVPGSDFFISFVDFAFNPAHITDETVYAYTWCTNRFLATQVPAGGKLETEQALPVSQILCLYRPTPPIYSPTDGQTLWKLISQLTVDYLALSGPSAIEALRESLRLFAGDLERHHWDMEALRTLEVAPATKRLGEEGWRGFVRGLRITLEVDQEVQGGGSAFLLSRVLQQFFALTVSLNSFVELVLRNRQEVWKQWPPQIGERALI